MNHKRKAGTVFITIVIIIVYFLSDSYVRKVFDLHPLMLITMPYKTRYFEVN